jgi:signal transduction histidine kinase
LQLEVKRLRQELKDANDTLEQEREAARRSQALAEVATLLAHEIRNPLASLELFAGLLADSSELAENNAKIVGHIQAGLRTLAATVNNVLQFHSVPPPQLTATNLANVVCLTLDFLRPLAEQSGVELIFDDHLGDVQIGADAHRLQQVLLNLAMNAMRFMPAGGRFEVRGSIVGEGQVAELRVCDTGPGIAPENQERIFDAGFTTRPGSPGLGLAVCKKILEQHGGSICLAPDAQGAEFIVRMKVL